MPGTGPGNGQQAAGQVDLHALIQQAVTHALAAGATNDEIVAPLQALPPVTGTARVVQCAPKLALALGYDVEDALERPVA